MKHFKTMVFLLMSVLLIMSTSAFATDYYRPWVRTQDLTVKNVPVFEAGLGIETSGDVWYVDSGASGTAAGTSWTDASLTVDAAINLAAASNGDLIRVAAGHAESYAAANGFDLDKAGITIVHEGSIYSQATYTFTDTDGTIAVGAAGCRIFGGRYLAGVSAVVAGFMVEAAGDDFELIDAVFPEPTTSSFEFVDAIDLAAAADGVKIIRPTQFTADAIGAAHFIDAGNGVNNNLQIIEPYLYGEYSVSAIWSDTVDLEVLIQGGSITNLTNGEHAIEFTGAALGSIKDVLVRTDVQTTAVDPGSMTISNVLWDDDAVADSTSSPVAPNYFTVTAVLSEATWQTVAAHEIAQVTGAVRMQIMAEVTETAVTTSNDGTMALGFAGNTAAIFAATALDSAGTTFTDGDVVSAVYGAAATTPVAGGDAQSALTSVIFDVVSTQGVDVGYSIATHAATDGTVVFHIWWEPLDATGAVVAGAGGPF